MLFKKLIGQIHLWVGLIVSLLFFVIALSGAILTWGPELKAITFKQKIKSQEASFVLPSKLKSTMDREFPQGDYRTAFYRGKDQTCEVLLYGQGTYYIAQLNPYTAELVHLQDMKKGWLSVVLGLHRNLLIKKFGRELVHWITLAFLILMVTGIVLWWPKNKQGRRSRLTVKWGASPKKLNYDLHNVLGFYATWISLFIVITGLFWGFDVVKNGLKWVTNEYDHVYADPKSDENGFDTTVDSFVLMDSLTVMYRNRFPGKNIRISNPHAETDPINVVINDQRMLGYTSAHYYHDRYSGEELIGHFQHGPGDQASDYEVIHTMIYDIHFGTIAGLPGRLLVFLASLIAASLPITGFIYWLGRRAKT